jgi:hypothetical protein
MPYDVILEVRVRSDRIASLDRMAEKLKAEPHDFPLPAGHKEWNGSAVASMLLAEEIDECVELGSI